MCKYRSVDIDYSGNQLRGLCCTSRARETNIFKCKGLFASSVDEHNSIEGYHQFFKVEYYGFCTDRGNVWVSNSNIQGLLLATCKTSGNTGTYFHIREISVSIKQLLS